MVDATSNKSAQLDTRSPTKVLVSLEEDDEFEDFPVEGKCL